MKLNIRDIKDALREAYPDPPNRSELRNVIVYLLDQLLGMREREKILVLFDNIPQLVATERARKDLIVKYMKSYLMIQYFAEFKWHQLDNGAAIIMIAHNYVNGHNIDNTNGQSYRRYIQSVLQFTLLSALESIFYHIYFFL